MALPPTSTPTGKSVRQRLEALNPSQAAAFRQYVAGATQPAPQATGGSGLPAFVLPGAAESQYLIGRENVNEDYSQQLAQNAFDRSQASAAYAPQFRDLALNFNRQREAMPGSYIARGVYGQSGIWNQGLQNYATDRLNAVGDLNLARSQSMARYDFNKTQLARRRALALANLAMQHSANLGTAATASVV